MANGRSDLAGFSEDRHLLHRAGRWTVGYMLGIEYAIDEPLFDGGGASLYIHLEGDLVVEVEWWG
ncbi:MAG: hypothetical protein AAGF12_24120 [Myxococcota bacterium]